MKRIATIALILSMIFTSLVFVGCGNDDGLDDGIVGEWMLVGERVNEYFFALGPHVMNINADNTGGWLSDKEDFVWRTERNILQINSSEKALEFTVTVSPEELQLHEETMFGLRTLILKRIPPEEHPRYYSDLIVGSWNFVGEYEEEGFVSIEYDTESFYAFKEDRTGLRRRWQQLPFTWYFVTQDEMYFLRMIDGGSGGRLDSPSYILNGRLYRVRGRFLQVFERV